MRTTADKMIAALDAFEAGSNDDHALSKLYAITEAFETLPDKARVVPSMLSVIERCGEADLGSPGPLVHCIESLDYELYLSRLIDSVRRKPSYLNVWMVNRILNAHVRGEHREQLLELLRSVTANPAASASVIKETQGFLQNQVSAG
ncbi:MAG: hypothetical protein K8T91_03860 [Planctomycetes bacterium]|nr:hypothetical protein [Planctomycetota bacterium]